MRVAIVTESFLPQVNGVTNSVLRVCEQLSQRGHQALIIAPGPGPTEWSGFPVVRTSSLPLPGYNDFRIARPFPGLLSTLREFGPDVVHLASPAVLGAQGAFAAPAIPRRPSPAFAPVPPIAGPIARRRPPSRRPRH